ncbi:predicted protein [Chaetoceros tenuissimus]|uniref:Uncharacterized protein n=1 Tax=Chaetoceros tenuissimus TaxID=426638 RepID=A0AAD3D733_9STRA|nr:predicted protein [Chaetoceros tenuissimus]
MGRFATIFAPRPRRKPHEEARLNSKPSPNTSKPFQVDYSPKHYKSSDISDEFRRKIGDSEIGSWDVGANFIFRDDPDAITIDTVETSRAETLITKQPSEEMIRFDFDPAVSFDLGITSLDDLASPLHEPPEPVFFRYESADSAVTTSVALGAGEFVHEKNKAEKKLLDIKNKISERRMKKKNPHNEFIAKRYDAKKILNGLNELDYPRSDEGLPPSQALYEKMEYYDAQISIDEVLPDGESTVASFSVVGISPISNRKAVRFDHSDVPTRIEEGEEHNLDISFDDANEKQDPEVFVPIEKDSLSPVKQESEIFVPEITREAISASNKGKKTASSHIQSLKNANVLYYGNKRESLKDEAKRRKYPAGFNRFKAIDEHNNYDENNFSEVSKEFHLKTHENTSNIPEIANIQESVTDANHVDELVQLRKSERIAEFQKRKPHRKEENTETKWKVTPAMMRDDPLSVHNILATLSDKFISAPRLCKGSKAIPTIIFVQNEQEDEHQSQVENEGPIPSSRQKSSNADRIKWNQISNVTSLPVEEKILRPDTVGGSSALHGASNKSPVGVEELTENRPWRKPKVTLKTVRDDEDTIEERELIRQLQSRVRAIIEGAIPNNISIDKNNITLDKAAFPVSSSLAKIKAKKRGLESAHSRGMSRLASRSPHTSDLDTLRLRRRQIEAEAEARHGFKATKTTRDHSSSLVDIKSRLRSIEQGVSTK